MKKHVISAALSLIFLNSASAALTLERIPISDSFKIESAKKALSIPLLGAGIRKKTFLGIKVYVASVFAKNEKSWENAEEPIAIRIDFLRNIPNDKIIDSFTNSLKTNKVDIETPAMKKLFKIVKKNGDIKENQSLTVAGTRGIKEQLTLTLSTGETQTVEGNKGLVKDFFSIWFGKMDDGGLEDLRADILAKKNI